MENPKKNSSALMALSVFLIIFFVMLNTPSLFNEGRIPIYITSEIL
jgi:hypothetical protein